MAKRRSGRAHGGTVYQSDGQWYAAVMINGRRRRRKARSRAEALRKRQQLVELAHASSGLEFVTFGQFRARWLDHVQTTKAAKTHSAYLYALQPFDALKPIPLDSITAAAVQRCLDPLTGRAQQLAFDKLRQLLRQAVKWGCLSVNPMDRLERPNHTVAKVEPFERAEVVQMLEQTAGTRYGAAIRLALAVGLRGGELWGLQWSDLQGNQLQISRQASENAGHIEIKAPKTSSGVRRLLLPDSCVDALHERRKAALRDGQAQVPWMFPNEAGNVTRRSNFGNRQWKRLLEKLTLRHRGFHHARHTAATLLLNSGVPLTVVSKTLGHASPAITLQIYAHVMTSDLQQHRNAFDKAISAS